MDPGKSEKCHYSVLNLYSHLRRDEVPPNWRFIVNEIFDTEKCQEYHDLRRVREATTEKLRETAPSGKLEEALRSEEACAVVVAHYQVWYKDEVLRTLRWRTQLHYYCVDYNYAIQIGTSISLGTAFGFVARSPVFGALVAGATGACWKIFKKIAATRPMPNARRNH